MVLQGPWMVYGAYFNKGLKKKHENKSCKAKSEEWSGHSKLLILIIEMRHVIRKCPLKAAITMWAFALPCWKQISLKSNSSSYGRKKSLQHVHIMVWIHLIFLRTTRDQQLHLRKLHATQWFYSQRLVPTMYSIFCVWTVPFKWKWES